MKTPLLLLSVLLLSGTGFAHDGHPHVGDPVTHHLVEGVVLVAVVAVLAFWACRRSRRAADERV